MPGVGEYKDQQGLLSTTHGGYELVELLREIV